MDNTEIIEVSFSIEVSASIDRKMLLEHLHTALVDAETNSKFTLCPFEYNSDVTYDG